MHVCIQEDLQTQFAIVSTDHCSYELLVGEKLSLTCGVLEFAQKVFC